ncbi:hypothetical protein [Conexibacter woesei]|uniref:hypothetical protein n=1 Tax=Conexibacter woesei TaxID=191495 RepID=UPI0003FE5D42|nr:hypothetical protein [Conexibacter woesei]
MRAYTNDLSFAPGTVAEDVSQVVAAWRGRHSGLPADCGRVWTPGTDAYELADGKSTVEINVLEAAEGRLWQFELRHPHAEDPATEVVARVTVGDVAERVSASVLLHTELRRHQITDERQPIHAPRVVADLLRRFEVLDAGQRLTPGPAVLASGEVDSFIDELLLSPDRTRPVLLASDNPLTLAPAVDPVRLAKETAGLAHTFFTLYGLPGAALHRRLGGLGCPPGAVRLWWPGMTLDDDPLRHPLWSLERLRAWRGRRQPITVIAERIGAAAAVVAAPADHSRIRRKAKIASLTRTGDGTTDEWLADYDRTLKTLDETRDDLQEMREQRDVARAELEDAQEQIDALRRQIEEERRNTGLALAQAVRPADAPQAEPGSDADDDRELAVPGDVAEALAIAEERCPHLVVTRRARESAADSPFEQPAEILDVLLRLERLAALWAREGGIGKSIADKARELGLAWRGDVSMSTRPGGSRADQYEFSHDGQTWTMGPHVALGSGSGAGKVARIYFSFDDQSADKTEWRFVLGQVGRKLEDSTT